MWRAVCGGGRQAVAVAGRQYVCSSKGQAGGAGQAELGKPQAGEACGHNNQAGRAGGGRVGSGGRNGVVVSVRGGGGGRQGKSVYVPWWVGIYRQVGKGKGQGGGRFFFFIT